jgi:hypothetical protein
MNTNCNMLPAFDEFVHKAMSPKGPETPRNLAKWRGFGQSANVAYIGIVIVSDSC